MNRRNTSGHSNVRGRKTMFRHSWKTTLLLIPILLATLRPVVGSNGLIEASLFGRMVATESEEERGEGERDNDPDADANAEGRKTRRTVHSLRWSFHSSFLIVSLSESKNDRLPPIAGLLTTSEHALRFGVGAPLRI